MTHWSLKSTLATMLLVLALPAFAAAKQPDRDGDRMPDRWERKHKLSVKKNDAARDLDRDGLRNLAEYRAKTNPRKADSDRDGWLDGDEDRDRDRVDNANEDRERTDPGRKDSDGDGVRDSDEDADRDGLDNEGEDVTGNDPIDPDSDDDGVKDGAEEAGTVVSFADGVLVVRVADGETVRGLVTDETEIECESEDDLELWDDEEDEDWLGVRTAYRGGDSSDSSGPGKGNDDRPDDGSKDESKDDSKDDDSDDEGWDGDWGWEDDEDEESCGTEALVAGAGVHEAKLVLTGDGAVFTKIELVATAPVE